MKEKFRGIKGNRLKLLKEIQAVIDNAVLKNKYPDLDFDDLFYVLDKIKFSYTLYWLKKAGWIKE